MSHIDDLQISAKVLALLVLAYMSNLLVLVSSSQFRAQSKEGNFPYKGEDGASVSSIEPRQGILQLICGTSDVKMAKMSCETIKFLKVLQLPVQAKREKIRNELSDSELRLSDLFTTLDNSASTLRLDE